MRALPDWTKQVRAVHTVLRELDAMARYELRPERVRAWGIRRCCCSAATARRSTAPASSACK